MRASDQLIPVQQYRPHLYIAIVVCALLAGVPLYLRTQGVFACPVAGYGADAFIAECRAGAYGDYDHGAFWYGLEPAAMRSAASADVLFLGNSRLQFGLSTGSTAQWFDEREMSFFLLGFSDTETVAYFEPVLARLAPRPQAVVINVDRIFDSRVSRPTTELLDADGRLHLRYLVKRKWQSAHRAICQRLQWLCGRSTVIYRSRIDGTWELYGERIDRPMPVSEGAASERERWPLFAGLGTDFVARLPVARECVILTLIPTVDGQREEALAIASALGLDLITPHVPELTTFDGSHLDAKSAERWSAAFLASVGPRLDKCMER